MGFLASLRRGWRLGIKSVRLVVAEPELLAFPLLGGAVLFGLAVVGAVAGLLSGGVLGALGDAGLVVGAAGAFVATFLATTVSTFFSAALVHCAAATFRGEEPDVRDGLAAAWAVRRKILLWGLVAATVSLVLRQLERRGGPAGSLVSLLFGIAWGVLTYFIVPVIVLEDTSFRNSFEESGRAFRETWGENLGGGVGVGLVFVAAFLAAFALFVLLVVFASPTWEFALLWVLAFVGVLLVMLPFGQAVTGVLKTALYVYARHGEVPEAYRGEDFAHLLGDAGEPDRSRDDLGQAGRI